MFLFALYVFFSSHTLFGVCALTLVHVHTTVCQGQKLTLGGSGLLPFWDPEINLSHGLHDQCCLPSKSSHSPLVCLRECYCVVLAGSLPQCVDRAGLNLQWSSCFCLQGQGLLSFPPALSRGRAQKIYRAPRGRSTHLPCLSTMVCGTPCHS